MELAYFRVTLAAAALLTATVSANAQDSSTKPAKPLPAVVVAPAEMMPIGLSQNYTGRMRAISRVAIVARVSGYLQKQNFEAGDTITGNDPLYQIEASSYAASVKQAQGALAAAKAQQELAETEKNRTKTLVDRGDFAQAQLDTANATLGQAVGTITQLEGALDEANIQLGYTKILAPFDGTIGISNVDVGAFVSQNTGELTTLTQLDPIYVEFQVPTAKLLTFQKLAGSAGDTGTKLDINIRQPDGTVYPTSGEWNFVDTAVSQGTDTVTVRALFKNPDYILFDGELVVVLLTETDPKKLLSVPLQSVLRDMVGPYVFTVDDAGKVSRTDVKIGIVSGSRIEIKSGLDEGASVITEGLNKVQVGITVDAAQRDDKKS